MSLKAEVTDAVVSRVLERLPGDEAAQVEEFVRRYYGWVAEEDLAGRSPIDLYGAALSHWGFAHERKPGEAKVRVYNPQHEEHGWQSSHTVVEIVCDDMPFLVDSVRMEINRQQYAVHLMLHPMIEVRRDAEGRLAEVLDPDSSEGVCESFIHVEVDRHTEPEALEALGNGLRRVLADVRVAVEDWRPMRERVHEIVAELEAGGGPVDPDEAAEAREFLRWIEDNNFTFLGYREYELAVEDGEEDLRAMPQTGLGILRRARPGPSSRSFRRLSPEARRLARAPHPLILTKANSRATVHRPSYLDYVGVKKFDENGEVVGERRFLGLYTFSAYSTGSFEIPVVRRKVEGVLRRAGFPPHSHNEKDLVEILETYPRDELFQISEDELFEIAIGILHLQERQRVRLFVRQDTYGRFFSCLVFVPRDRYNTHVRKRMRDILQAAFDGTSVEFDVRFSESVLARIHFVVHTRTQGELPAYDVGEIENRLVEATRDWTDGLYGALLERCGEERGVGLFHRYREAFPPGYRDDFLPRTAVADVAQIEELASEDDIGMRLYHPLEAPPEALRLKLFRRGENVPLSDVMPILENMGVKVVDQRPYKVEAAGSPAAWINDFGLTYEAHGGLQTDEVKGIFGDAFAQGWRGAVENDGFNRLVLGARLTWRQVSVLRALSRYLRQAGITFSQAYIEETLAGNPNIARLLVELFEARFDPREPNGTGREAEEERLTREIEEALDGVASLDQDRIIRSFFDVTTATLRTNYYRTGPDGPLPYLSFKFDSQRVSILPRPRPMFEIFVYSPRAEGIHLRGGKVARGGIRWSDRREDFRTEVLGLMKAQTVKNAVIVPVGAKGGFVVKRPPAGGGREAMMEEVVYCYSTLIRGMLDLTDNLVEGETVAPPDVVRYDEDDPYLVVAADKGTATFSDIANGISGEYGFWLGDAFASGGSSGYDHKAMGITARGAWESVSRHFRELGMDIQTTDFTVVGIGDMSGDVFGNGMLLSPCIRLVAAFNHQHIFLDPDPDPETSFGERERLFGLPRSSWADYDAGVLSPGGGVFERAAKSIPLSPEVRSMLGVEESRMPPNDVIRALLTAPVDLLWNGGIGTYVKASDETNADVGDKTNDALRVDARDLRCRVVGEGGNLGFTQRGRIEYALDGGRIYTDAIDNSAGVDCSDHEVNIKILLDDVVESGDMTVKQRNELLARMTEEVARLVLLDNYEQTQTINNSLAQAASMVDVHARYIHALEAARKLDRGIEHLPDDETLSERRSNGRGLTAPEIAVLLSYTKLTLYNDLLHSDVPEDPYLSAELERYFPTPLRERFSERMEGHRLRREIVSTVVTNDMVNRAGTTFAFRMEEETGAGAAQISRAYAAAREIFDMRDLWSRVEALDNEVAAETQTEMLLASRRLVERATRWLLQNRRPIDVAATMSFFSKGATELAGRISDLTLDSQREDLDARTAKLTEAGVPEPLARRVASLDLMFSALDVIEVAAETGKPVQDVAVVYLALGDRLRIDWLRSHIDALPRQNRWQTLARAALRNDLYGLQAALAADVVRSSDGRPDAAESIEEFIGSNQGPAERALQMLSDINAGGTFDLSTLSVAVREVRNLANAVGK